MSLSTNSAYSNWEPPSPTELQAILPAYGVIRLLGRGGMGAVYEGIQRNLDRRVAIKLLPVSLRLSEEGAGYNFAERFQREARSMASLDHPAIVGVYDFGRTTAEDDYLAMEFVDGTDLHQYRHQLGGKIPPDHTVPIVDHVLEALQYAHDNGVIHRDIKPANILIDRNGKVKIADFGLAKRASEGANGGNGLTLTNMALGTPDYAAPEITAAGAAPDHRVDLFAVGVVLYELLTGVVPRGRWRPPSERLPSLGARFDAVAEKALQADPEGRFSSAREFREALDRALAEAAPMVRVVREKPAPYLPAPANRTDRRPAKKAATPAPDAEEETRKPILTWILAGGIPLLALALFFVVHGQKAASTPPPEATGPDEVSAEKKPDGVYAGLADRMNREIERRDAEGARSIDPDRASADSVSGAASSLKTPSEARTAPGDSPSPPPSVSQGAEKDNPDTPGPPLMKRWRPLLDDRKLNRDGTLLENGDAFLAPCKAAQVKLKEPIDTVLVRWRGFRGNSMSVEYIGGNKAFGRRSFHVGKGGGTSVHLGPPSGPGAARSFDSQWYVLIRGNEKHVWEVADGKDPAVSANVGEVSAATDIKELKITTWNPHYLPYFKPALIRRCDTLIPTEEQLAELLAARTTAALLDLPWVAQPKDEAYDAFLGAVDEACEKLAVADFRAARSQAETLLGAQPLLKENPHREILESVRDTAAALIAIEESAASKSPWPELKGNRQYRLDPATGHAFVSLPLLLTANEAATFAQKTPGHLATLAPAEETQRALADAWLVPTVPLGIVTRREGRFVQGWHLGGMPRGNSGWSWITGEPLPAEGVGASWRSGRLGYDPQMAAIWELGGKEAENKRRATLGWETISASTRAFSLIEFPALATRYPNPQWNHPAARNEPPGSTGDPLVDFENRFTHQWRETVTKPWSAIDGQLRDKYATALESRARTIAQAGTLDAVLPWHFEIKTVREGGTPPALDATTPEELRRLRTVWDAEAAKVAAQRESLTVQAVAAADAELAAVEKQFVQSGQIEPAAAVQARRKQLAAREGLPE